MKMSARFCILLLGIFYLKYIYSIKNGFHQELLNNKSKSVETCFEKSKASGITAYYINLDDQLERRKFTEAQLNKFGISFKRISAISPNSSEYNITMLEQPCKRNTPKDLSVILSHLKAIYTAVHDPIVTRNQKRSRLDNYALILEDDVRFLYDVDYRMLIDKAPRKFGMLQLITSNPEAVDLLWAEFLHSNCNGFNNTVGNNASSAISDNSFKKQKACAEYADTMPPLPKPKVKRKKEPDQLELRGIKFFDDMEELEEPIYELTPARLHYLEAIKYWKLTNWNDLSRNRKTNLYWSTQAYIINKRVAWKFLADIVQVTTSSIVSDNTKTTQPNSIDTTGAIVKDDNMQDTGNEKRTSLSFKIVNSFNAHICNRRSTHPCILGSCLYSYSYIYSAGQPTHISLLPLFTGSKLGQNSNMHPEHLAGYNKAFSLIKGLTSEIRKNNKRGLLPDYIHVPSGSCLRIIW